MRALTLTLVTLVACQGNTWRWLLKSLGDEDWEGPPTIGTSSNSKVDARAALMRDCDEDIAKRVDHLKMIAGNESDASTESSDSNLDDY